MKFILQKNCKILVSFPAYYTSSNCFKGNDLRAVQDMTDCWNSQIDVRLLSPYSENLYDIGDFYDGNYHMNEKGRDKRTEQIILELKLAL